MSIIRKAVIETVNVIGKRKRVLRIATVEERQYLDGSSETIEISVYHRLEDGTPVHRESDTEFRVGDSGELLTRVHDS